MAWSPTSQRSREILSTPLLKVPGVGPKLSEKLAKIGIRTVEDALYTLPIRYEDRREIKKIAQLRVGETSVFVGEILASGESQTSRSRRRLWEVVVGDGSGKLSLKWFHFRASWMKQRFKVGDRAFFTGELKRFGAIREMHHPDAEFIPPGKTPEQYCQADPLSFGRILPVYPLTEGLHQKTARKIWKHIVDHYASQSFSALPDQLIDKYDFLSIPDALQEVHWPNSGELASLNSGVGRARLSLVFDEFFYLELGLALRRKGVVIEPGRALKVEHRYTKPLAAMLPFQLTAAQRRVLGEIKRDLMQPHPMNRLVQGDVGCGKTIVALMAALLAIENNLQVAVVAPTEILAEQHFLQYRHWLEALGLSCVLLSGGLKPATRKSVLAQIRDGSAAMVVGTHAVLQEGVEFHRLGLGIVDEQHRFGVEQRGILRKKGENPHILVMTATPIPRSLTMTVFGDLALSVIDELPPGRTPVRTVVRGERQRSEVYAHLRRQLQAGRQAYIVYPLIEESEKSDLQAAEAGFSHLSDKVLAGHQLALLHGRLKPDEKEAIMQRFKAGEIEVLIATTVIEVGIDVPNATLMLIENAERFGLAQLHQLRGRVGRGSLASDCILMRSNQCSDDGRKRLEVMCSTHDGFRIAEADLEIRGPGDVLGTRQSGLPDFRVASLLRDGRILEQARQEAFALAAEPDFPDHPRYRDLMETLLHRWGTRLDLARVG